MDKGKEPGADAIDTGRTVVDGVLTFNTQPSRVTETVPSAYRLMEKKDGRLVLQGAYKWTQGFATGGVEWRDQETVKEDK